MSNLDAQKAEQHARLIEQMRRTLGDEICAVFEDRSAVEIMLNDDGRVLIERHGHGITALTHMTATRALTFLSLMAAYRETVVGKEKPIVEGAMPEEFRRSRFAGCIPPLTPMPTFSIRLPTTKIFTLDDYVSSGILTEEQRGKLVAAIEGRKNILVSGGTGCFAKGHPILMFDGSIKPVEEVVAGDEVMGPDGTPRRVKEAHVGLDHMVEVIPFRGPSFVVNQGHKLALIETHKATRKQTLLPVMEWGRQTGKFRHTHKLYQMPSAIYDLQPIDAPIDPYFLGVLLGDGSFVSSVSVSKPDLEIRTAVESSCDTFGLDMHTYMRSENNPTYKMYGGRGPNQNQLIVALKELGLYGKRGEDKFVPVLYRTASLYQRLELLAGLLDTDGYLSEFSNSFDFISKSERLAEDAVFLARSCGLYASIHPCEKSCKCANGSIYTGQYYRVYIGGNIGNIPTRIHRKQSTYSERDVVTVGIKEIRSVGVGAYYGFEVDHPDHLFVDGNFMVQGNSGKTTFLNALSDHIAKIAGLDQRIVIIEDTSELVCNAPNTVKMLTDFDVGIDMTRLLKLTLRYRPDRIFVGEVRDGAALALLKAWGTGHPGGLATLHANNPTGALTRLDQLCQEAGVPSQRHLIEEAVDVVVQITRDSKAPAGRRISDILFTKQ